MPRGPFSQRVPASLEPGPWARRLARLRAQGRALIDLTDFNPTTAGLDVAVVPLDASGVYEPDPAGLRIAREAVCAYYADRGVTVAPEHVILTASTSEAYAHAFRLFCEPGEAVLVPRPSYPLFDALARAEGCRLESYSWDLVDGAWSIAPLAALPDDVRAIVAVNPNHPTGAVLTHDDAAVLLRACMQRGIALVVDEVFADFPWFGGRPASSLAGSMLREKLPGRSPQPLKLVFSGLSKVCGLPHLKLGWIVVQGEPFERDAALERLAWLADTFLSVSQPVQHALPSLLAGRGRFQGSVRARVARNRGALAAAIAALPDAGLLPADAGWSSVIALPPVRTDEEWALALLEHDVIVHPGYFYGFDTPGRVVVSLLPPPATFDAAIAALFAVALG